MFHGMEHIGLKQVQAVIAGGLMPLSAAAAAAAVSAATPGSSTGDSSSPGASINTGSNSPTQSVSGGMDGRAAAAAAAAEAAGAAAAAAAPMSAHLHANGAICRSSSAPAGALAAADACGPELLLPPQQRKRTQDLSQPMLLSSGGSQQHKKLKSQQQQQQQGEYLNSEMAAVAQSLGWLDRSISVPVEFDPLQQDHLHDQQQQQQQCNDLLLPLLDDLDVDLMQFRIEDLLAFDTPVASPTAAGGSSEAWLLSLQQPLQRDEELLQLDQPHQHQHAWSLPQPPPPTLPQPVALNGGSAGWDAAVAGGSTKVPMQEHAGVAHFVPSANTTAAPDTGGPPAAAQGLMVPAAAHGAAVAAEPACTGDQQAVASSTQPAQLQPAPANKGSKEGAAAAPANAAAGSSSKPAVDEVRVAKLRQFLLEVKHARKQQKQHSRQTRWRLMLRRQQKQSRRPIMLLLPPPPLAARQSNRTALKAHSGLQTPQRQAEQHC